MVADFELKKLVKPLQDWFDGHARVLPWRDDPKAYKVWISEIMLQQTRVEAVKPYFARFMEALPDVEALAACPEDRYLKLWEGLGYYNRVRNLHAAAEQIMEQYGGTIPDTVEELTKLPGIGRKTANLIVGDIYHKPAVVCDTHCIRITNLLGLTTTKDPLKTERELRACLPMEKANDFCHRLVLHGRAVCIARRPQCGACVMAPVCKHAQALKKAEQL